MNNPKLSVPLCLLLAGLLSACGFHLRRPPDLPPSMRAIYVAAPAQSGELLRELRRSLASDQTVVLPTPEGASTILSIISVQQSSLPLAVNRAGNPLEYQVTYTVAFSLQVQGATVLEPQTVRLTRNYAYNVSNQVANEEQEQALNLAMAKDVSEFISFRVAAAARDLPPQAATAAVPAAATRPSAAPTQTPPAAATRQPPLL